MRRQRQPQQQRQRPGTVLSTPAAALTHAAAAAAPAPPPPLSCSTDGDDNCRGGALHSQDSWLGVSRSSFSANQGVNGSAVLVVNPVGIAQLADCQFAHNAPRPGAAVGWDGSLMAARVGRQGPWLLCPLVRACALLTAHPRRSVHPANYCTPPRQACRSSFPPPTALSACSAPASTPLSSSAAARRPACRRSRAWRWRAAAL